MIVLSRARGAFVRAAPCRVVSASSAFPSVRRTGLSISHGRWTTSAAVPRASASIDSDSDSAKPGADLDGVDHIKIDLGTIGAEDATVVTIADILNARERDVATNKALVDFEAWESIAGSETIHDAVVTMVERTVGSLIVTDVKEGIVGIVTERDILKKVSPRTVLQEKKVVRDIMSSHIMCIQPSTTVIDALATLTKENIRHLAVVNGDMTSAVKRGSVQEEDMRCVLSIKDIVRAYAELEASKTVSTAHQDHVRGQEKQQEMNATETEDAAPASVVTAATLLKKKHKRIKLILNTRPDDHVSVAKAVEEMAKRDFGAVLVVDKEQRVLGIFTERDYICKVLFELKDPTKVLVTDVMSTVDRVLQTEDSLEKCWDLAATSSCRHFPVIGVMRPDREKELAGILSIKDIVREISKDHRTTPGFRLMEFLKSKMESKRVEQKPDQKTESTTKTHREAATEGMTSMHTEENKGGRGTSTGPASDKNAVVT
ncbi:hypothetical protein PsorP6_011863 [Peronosclerospora sorghi]|uniref:Uncharacterized protein n=1 Tax=Peronosclerospora sorghi TaxID=230839 RepID=A0ACC0WL37_9STRA|nr:hypothetical protein PsorP6_011863 [Peronosclerospora sorghi]